MLIKFFLSLAFILGFSYAKEAEWLYTLPAVTNEIIGYGVDKEYSAAKQKALADISETINVIISSTHNSVEELHNDKLDLDVKISIDSQSQANLYGAKVLKSEHIDELWYVAVSFDNSVFEAKMKHALEKFILKDEKQNPFLAKSLLFSRLNSELKHKLNYKVIRANGLWYLKYKDILQPLNEKNFIQLFSITNGKNLTFKANKNIYYSNDKMYFTVNFKKPGYLSILYVESNGKVGILLNNKKHNKTMQYPDTKSEDVFTVVNLSKKTLTEMYIAIHSNTKIDLSKFEMVDSAYLDDSNYNFGILTNKFKDVDFASSIIKIRN